MRNLCMYAAAVICLAGCGKQEDAKGNSSGNPITAPVDYLGAVNQARKGAVNTVDQAGLSKSIELFNVQEGRYPNDLNELSQKGYIHGEPSPPQGMQFQYDSKTGQLKIIPK